MSAQETAAASSDIIPLKHGYELEVIKQEDTWRGHDLVEFRMVKPDMTSRERRNQPSVEICPPFSRRKTYYTREWSSREEPEWGHVAPDTSRMTSPGDVEAMVEMLALAGDLLRAMHVGSAERLEEQASQHEQYLLEEKRQEEAREANRNKLKEELQWYVGHKFKLRRDGYKATVFGTIDRFTDTHVYTTSERGVRMDTRIEDINFFAVMYDGERRYTKVFERTAK